MDKQQGFSSLLATDSTDRRSPVRILAAQRLGRGWRRIGATAGRSAAAQQHSWQVFWHNRGIPLLRVDLA
jgi:hypothetical protein